MHGIVADCKTGEIKEVDDGLPMPEAPPYIEPVTLDLAIVAQKLKEIDDIKARLKKLEKK